jgi:hypothetical protein
VESGQLNSFFLFAGRVSHFESIVSARSTASPQEKSAAGRRQLNLDGLDRPDAFAKAMGLPCISVANRNPLTVSNLPALMAAG